MLEKEIESRVCRYSHERHGVTGYKFTSPARAAVPDRLFAFPPVEECPHGRTIYIEFKQTGKKPTPAQWREIDRLRAKGFPVYVCDDAEIGKMLIDWHALRYLPCPMYVDPKRPKKKP